MITSSDITKWHIFIMKCVTWKSQECDSYMLIFNWSYFSLVRSFSKLIVQSTNSWISNFIYKQKNPKSEYAYIIPNKEYKIHR